MLIITQQKTFLCVLTEQMSLLRCWYLTDQMTRLPSWENQNKSQ